MNILKKIKIKRIRSIIGCSSKTKLLIKGLGLSNINKIKEIDNTHPIRCMIYKVQHLIKLY